VLARTWAVLLISFVCFPARYIEILRNLRLKCPKLVEAHGFLDARGSRRLAGNTALKAAIMRPPDRLGTLTANTWSFPELPIVLLAPGEYSWNSNHLKGWKEHFSLLGKVIYGPESAASARDTKGLARSFMKKVQEAKQKWPRRPIVLIGFSVGAKVAITVSFNVPVDCLICLGPQMQGMAGNLADAVDTRDLIQLKPPTLFAIGSQSRLCPVALMEQVGDGQVLEFVASGPLFSNRFAFRCGCR
jgi:predicted esterase